MERTQFVQLSVNIILSLEDLGLERTASLDDSSRGWHGPTKLLWGRGVADEGGGEAKNAERTARGKAPKERSKRRLDLCRLA